MADGAARPYNGIQGVQPVKRVGWRSALPLVLALLAGGRVATAAGGKAEGAETGPWRPRKPVTLIVPREAGSLPDQVARGLALELEEALGQQLVVINLPADGGAEGVRAVLRARRDGYTWGTGGAAELGTLRVRGEVDTRWQDWELFLVAAEAPLVLAGAATPFQLFPDLAAATGERGVPLVVATAGEGSSGYALVLALAGHMGLRWRHLPAGEEPAAPLAAAAGRAELALSSAEETTELLLARRLRVLAVAADRPLELEGLGEVPPITRWLPRLKPTPEYYGLWIPRGVPAPVLEALSRLWDGGLRGSRRLRDLCARRGLLFDPCRGEVAVFKTTPALQRKAWDLHDRGLAPIPPDRLGIPRP